MVIDSKNEYGLMSPFKREMLIDLLATKMTHPMGLDSLSDSGLYSYISTFAPEMPLVDYDAFLIEVCQRARLELERQKDAIAANPETVSIKILTDYEPV